MDATSRAPAQYASSSSSSDASESTSFASSRRSSFASSWFVILTFGADDVGGGNGFSSASTSGYDGTRGVCHPLPLLGFASACPSQSLTSSWRAVDAIAAARVALRGARETRENA